MKYRGHIEIKDNKIVFVYHKYGWKPIWHDYENHPLASQIYTEEMKKYKASKRLIEVSNIFWSDISEEWLFGKKMKGSWANGPKNSQPCEAEIINNKAEIIKII